MASHVTKNTVKHVIVKTVFVYCTLLPDAIIKTVFAYCTVLPEALIKTVFVYCTVLHVSGATAF